MLSVLLIVLAVLIGLSILLPAFVGGAWSPTSMQRVRSMLRNADLKPGEFLVDLGAGDGRVLLTASREFDARAIGLEIDPLRYWLCRWRIALARLHGRVRVERVNFFDFPLHDVDVITFYLSQAAADRLQTKFQSELRPGARIVSHRRPLKGWEPHAIDQEHDLYVYVMRPEASTVRQTRATDSPPSPASERPA